MLVPSFPGPQNSLVELSLTQTSGLPPPTDSYSPWPRPKEHYFLQAPVVILMLGSETTVSGTSPFGLPWATSKKGLAFPTHRSQSPGSLAFSVVPTPSLPFTLRMIFFPRCSLSNCSINSTPHLSFLRQLSNNSPFVLTSFLYLLRDSISPGPRSKSSLCQLMRSGCKSDQLGPCSASASSPVDRE